MVAYYRAGKQIPEKPIHEMLFSGLIVFQQLLQLDQPTGDLHLV